MELMVVVLIIIIITAVALPNYQSGGQRLALQRSAVRLAQDIRLVQEMAMGSRDYTGCADPAGYGIYFHTAAEMGPVKPGPGAYYLFIDCPPLEGFDGGSDPIIERVEFEPGIEFTGASYDVGGPPNHATIIFYPPGPEVFIECDPGCQWIDIKFDINGKEEEVRINKKGLIYVK